MRRISWKFYAQLLSTVAALLSPHNGGNSISVTYESVEDKFHGPTVTSSGEFHGSSSRYLDREASAVCLLNKELSFISARMCTTRATAYHVARTRMHLALIALTRTCARSLRSHKATSVHNRLRARHE